MPSIILPWLLAIAAITGEQGQRARLLNLDELVTAEDYPRTALMHGEEGTVTVRVEVSPEGFVTSCRVAKSSGSTALDEQTCAVFRARARFEPARDRKGRPAAANFTQRITWRLAGDPRVPMPRQAWMLQTTIAVSGEGGIVDCKQLTTGLSRTLPDCDAFIAVMKEAGLHQPRATVAGYGITLVNFYPVEPAKLTVEPKIEGATEVGRQVSQITIAPDGHISDCKAVRYSGEFSPAADVCASILNQRFEPASSGAGELTGTVVSVRSIRKQSIT